MKILRESLLNEHDWKQPGDDSRMAKIQLKSIRDNVEELLEKIGDGDQLDAWVQTLIAKSQDDISSVRDYIVYGEDEETEVGPEVITDNPPMDIAPEAPVPMAAPEMEIDSEDELEMDDLGGPGPDVADNFDDEQVVMGDDFDDNDDYEEASKFDGEEEEEGYDSEMEPDHTSLPDLEDEDDMDEDYMMESLEGWK